MNTPPPDLLERLARALSGQYVVERLLGQGGMGTVFLARDVTLDRPVAIKVISPDVAASAELRQRFLLEARTVARLRHPNIVSVYSAGESDGLLWFAMEFVPGESLRDRLQRDRVVPANVVAAVVHDLAMALDEAHVAGVVHRDVKPENILLDQETGRAMLTDFGVARALSSGDSRLTGAGFVLGSPRYMSPEQAAGEETIDGRSDLYSLGLVAYEMLAGRPTIEAESAGTILIKQITEEPTPLRSLAVDVPDALDTVITRSLRKQPDQRYARGRAMAAVLEGRDEGDLAATSGGRIAAGISRPVPASTSPRARTRVLVGAAAVAAVAVGAFALTSRNSTAAPANERTWLVAPFELQTGNASLEWLREGAVNMLGLTLSQWNDLSVVDYERTLDLLRNESGDEARRVGLEDARQIARRASAGTVVMGQITTANDSLFVVARRYDVASGERIDEATAGAPLTADPRAVFERIAS
jgi:serine/threonine-protein kinase